MAYMTRSLGTLFLCALVVLNACAPEIGVRLAVPSVVEPETSVNGAIGARSIRVKVGTFTDTRPSSTLVVIDGRSVESEGAAGAVVQDGFSHYLRQAGARIAILNAPTIDGEITEWRAKVAPGFPSSEASAAARVKVTVRDTRAHPIYHATFSGEATASHPIMNAEKVQKLLAQAMASALEAAVRDEEFIAQLEKGRLE